MTPVSPRQFAVFRLAFGIFLAVHFFMLIPYGTELFSNQGVLPDPRLNLTFGILPNILEHHDTPAVITAFLISLSLLSVLFACGICRRFAAILLWYGWACLFNRNNLISNPSLPYVGLILLLTTLVPLGEGLTLRRRNASWTFPSMVQWTAWILLAAGYSFSGWMKLCSPSWQDGTALYYVLSNPLARSNWIQEMLVGLPPDCLRILTWSSLAAELLFLPLIFSRNTRLLAWSSLLIMNLGILLVINFADLTVGMLVAHLFTFDRGWFSSWARLARETLPRANISLPGEVINAPCEGCSPMSPCSNDNDAIKDRLSVTTA